jgi:ATP-dependent Clp endopeptidase proteolytic subunit ClpP
MSDRKTKSTKAAEAAAAEAEEVRDALEFTLEALEARRLQAEIAKLEVETARTKQQIDRDAIFARRDYANATEHRILTFYGEVGAESVARALTELGIWARRDPGLPIKVIFNSPGGSVFDGLALFDYLRELQADGHHITTVGLGMAASMGGVLLQAGQHRVMGRNAYMLIHEVSSLAWGNASELEDEVAFTKRLQDRLLDILAERSTLSKAQIARRWKRRDWWLSAQEALDLGFIDEIRDGAAIVSGTGPVLAQPDAGDEFPKKA